VSIELAGGAVDAEAEGFAQFVEARQLLSVHCPPGSGFLVETAVTIHGIAFVFASQNPTGTTAGDRAAFRKSLAGIRLQR
jgi:hypothetical protein